MKFIVLMAFIFTQTIGNAFAQEAAQKPHCYHDLFQTGTTPPSSFKRDVVLNPKNKKNKITSNKVCIDKEDKYGDCYCYLYLPQNKYATFTFSNHSTFTIKTEMSISVDKDKLRTVAFTISTKPIMDNIQMEQPEDFRVNCISDENEKDLKPEQAAFDVIDLYLKDAVQFPDVDASKSKSFLDECLNDRLLFKETFKNQSDSTKAR